MVTSSSPDQRPKAALTPTTDDAFLGGRVKILQPRHGFRAGLDAVMLAAAVPAQAGERVCDLGAGVGTAALCLSARVAGVHVTLVEIDDALALLATMNAARNGASFDVVVADVLKRPRALSRQHFDHVFSNPPYHDAARGTRASESAKARATSTEARELADWLRFACALVRPQGSVTVILPTEQLPNALAGLSPTGRGIEILPLWPKDRAPARRLIVRARMNARAPLIIRAGIVLHDGDGQLTNEANAILRRAEPLIT